jgi:hypothetical protein
MPALPVFVFYFTSWPLLKNAGNAAWGHAACMNYAEIMTAVGPVPSPGEFFNRLSEWFLIFPHPNFLQYFVTEHVWVMNAGIKPAPTRTTV